MPIYDFRSLSPVDFEHLTRDLLAAEWGGHVESFTSGQDGGVDLRYVGADGETTIVQCKHYADTSFSGLVRAVRKEAEKVQALSPDHYVLVTSQGLTPANKETLQEASGRATVVYGRDDLNALLSRHSDIETRTAKLWLASGDVLRRITEADTQARSAATATSFERTLQIYVQGSAHREARDLLDDLHYAVIAGGPGIGKTTLARVLCAEHVADGYDLIHVRGHVSEALRALHEGRKQIIYYDDFLGATALRSRLEKNEEADLLQLIDVIRQSDTTRFVLTTREYILNQAKRDYERLATSEFDWKLCTVDLDSYSRENRAEILYNHLYFSDLPQAYRDALLDDRTYVTIIDHEGYNPRLIEWMTTLLRQEKTPREAYASEFVRNLDNPDRLWSSAFDDHLSQPARSLMLTIATLPDGSWATVVEAAFDAYHSAQSDVYNRPRSPDDFENALRELDGTFVTTSVGVDTAPRIYVQSPSVRDFLEGRLRERPRLASALVGSAVAFEQVTFAHSGSFVSDSETWPRFEATFGSTPADLTWFRSEARLGRSTGVPSDQPERVRYIVEASCTPGAQILTPVSDRAVEMVIETLLADPYATGSFYRLMAAVQARPAVAERYGSRLHAFAESQLARSLDDLDSAIRYLDYHEAYATDDPVATEAVEGFLYDVEREVEEVAGEARGGDPRDIEHYLGTLLDVANRLGTAIPDHWEEMLDEAVKIAQHIEDEEREAYLQRPRGGMGGSPNGSITDSRLDAMFATLRDLPAPED